VADGLDYFSWILTTSLCSR